MVRIQVSFDLLSGLEDEYDRFVVEEGIPFWKSQPGIISTKGFRNLSDGSPMIVSQVDCQDLETARRILESPSYAQVIRQQAKYVINRSVLLLAPTGRSMESEI
ncbi:MAG: hypothetical protein JXA42_06815 [Anaerolineales bacterium]|nr:hypothetical protein [Anaerolineales bacterium]